MHIAEKKLQCFNQHMGEAFMMEKQKKSIYFPKSSLTNDDLFPDKSGRKGLLNRVLVYHPDTPAFVNAVHHCNEQNIVPVTISQVAIITLPKR